jgi:hypothetical protein
MLAGAAKHQLNIVGGVAFGQFDARQFNFLQTGQMSAVLTRKMGVGVKMSMV